VRVGIKLLSSSRTYSGGVDFETIIRPSKITFIKTSRSLEKAINRLPPYEQCVLLQGLEGKMKNRVLDSLSVRRRNALEDMIEDADTPGEVDIKLVVTDVFDKIREMKATAS